jgi:hypothetical protein
MSLIQQLPKIALTATLATLSSIIVAPAVFAITSSFNISGRFNDTGTITGSFTYDSNSSSYTNVDINTTPGNDITTETTYDDSDTFFGANATGVDITDLDTGFLLSLVFDPDLTDSSPSFSSFSFEDDFSNQRNLNSGTITAVPFDFSPSFGLLLLMTMQGKRILDLLRNNTISQK